MVLTEAVWKRKNPQYLDRIISVRPGNTFNANFQYLSCSLPFTQLFMAFGVRIFQL